MHNLPKLHIYAKLIPLWSLCGVFISYCSQHTLLPLCVGVLKKFSQFCAPDLPWLWRSWLEDWCTLEWNQSNLHNPVTAKRTFAIKLSNLCVCRPNCSFPNLNSMCVTGTISRWQAVGIIKMALACGSSLSMRAVVVKGDTASLSSSRSCENTVSKVKIELLLLPPPTAPLLLVGCESKPKLPR